MGTRFATAALLAFTVACGSAAPSGSSSTTSTGTTGNTTTTTTQNGNTTPTGPTGITVSGFVSAPALDGNVAALSNLEVVLIDPNVASPNNVIDHGPLDTNNAQCTPASCPFSFPGVNLSGTTVGLVVYVGDTRTTGATWEPTATGTASQATIAAAIASNGPLANNFAYAINDDGLANLARITNTNAKDANTLVANGTFVGSVIGNANDATAAGSKFPPAIKGATVTGPTGTKVYYPNTQLNGSGNSTSTNGLFVVVPTATPAPSGAYQIKAANNDNHTWAPSTVAIAAGVIYVQTFEAAP